MKSACRGDPRGRPPNVICDFVILSKKQIQWVRSLAIRKNRDREQAFIAEGPKVVGELINAGFECLFLAYTEGTSRARYLQGCSSLSSFQVSDNDLTRLSQLQTPQGVIAVFRIPAEPSLTLDASIPDGSTGDREDNWLAGRPQGSPLHAMDERLEGGFFSLLLDRVQDPGNVGTIIRLCDWFGVEDIFLSEGCADPWAPKVVQASMGALARVRVHTHVDAANLCKAVRTQGLPVYACVLDGENIFQADLSAPVDPPKQSDTAVRPTIHYSPFTIHHSSLPLVVLGNEGQGISQEVLEQVSRRLTIPNYPPGRPTSESLNVAMAAAIVLAEFRRQR